MQIESPARPLANAAPIGSDELAEGLMLVRASTLKMIRLQLAMERHDRRVALETVDDLIALDRRLQDYLASVPGAGGQLMFRRELDAERAALNREKLTLAAEVIRAPQPQPVQEARDDAWLGPRDLPAEVEGPKRSPWWLVAAAAPLLAAALAAGAYMVGVPQAEVWMAAAAEAFR